MTEPHAFLLVHGAWHGAWCWQWLSPLLSEAGHQVLSPTLPGHDRESDPRRIRFRDYLSCLSNSLDEARYPVIAVGHSMAGMLISALADSRPDDIRQLVYLNAYLPISGDSIFSLMNQENIDTGQIAAHMQLSADRRSYSLSPETLLALFYNHSPSTCQALATSSFCIQPSLPLAHATSLSDAGFGQVPRFAVFGRHDRVIPLPLAQWMLSRQPCEHLFLDTDHSPFASCPLTLAQSLLHLTRVS